MFTSGFTVADTHLKHLRGRENMKTFSLSNSVLSKNTMTSHFCGTCGTLMYRVSTGSPGLSILRIGTVDDFRLHETKLKPTVEQFTAYRASWVHSAEGAQQFEGSAFAGL